MKNIKQWVWGNVIARFSYGYWIRLREKTIDEYGDKLCYCGHTYKCSCSDPCKKLFKDSVRRGNIYIFDKNNGWISKE